MIINRHQLNCAVKKYTLSQCLCVCVCCCRFSSQQNPASIIDCCFSVANHDLLRATENAGLEMQEQTASVENAGVGKPYGKPNRHYTLRYP